MRQVFQKFLLSSVHFRCMRWKDLALANGLINTNRRLANHFIGQFGKSTSFWARVLGDQSFWRIRWAEFIAAVFGKIWRGQSRLIGANWFLLIIQLVPIRPICKSLIVPNITVMNSVQQNLQNEWSPNPVDQKEVDFPNLWCSDLQLY